MGLKKKRKACFQAFSLLGSLYKMNYEYLRGSIERHKFLLAREKLIGSCLPSAEEVLDQKYVFVLSTGRCGTKLITEILLKSPLLRVEHSPKPELEYASSIVHRDSIEDDALRLAIVAARFDLFFLDTFLRGRIYVETNNRVSLFGPALAKLLPNAKFIHLVRDPADFVRSGMRRNYYNGRTVQHQRLDGSRNFEWNYFSPAEKIMWEWNEINSRIEDLKSELSSDRVLTIKSEALFSCLDVTRQIYGFIGVDNPFDSKRGERALSRLLSKPVNSQKVGDFPHYPDWSLADKEALKRIATMAEVYEYFHN